MPRTARNNLNAVFLHIMVQGINKETIFHTKGQKEKYKQYMFEHINEYKIEILAYCIMDNHAHILIYSESKETLSKYMHKINLLYAQYYNFMKKRCGVVFRNRFLSEQINDRKYLLNCISYIHKNPVKANMVKNSNDYEYSSYKLYIDGKMFISRANIQTIFGSNEINLEMFKAIHKEESYFLDVDLNLEEITNNIIKTYLYKFNENKIKVLNDIDELKKLVTQIKETHIRIPNTIIAKELGISIKKLERITK